MAKGRPRNRADDVLIRSAELIGWALGGIEREIVETRHRLAALTERATQLRKQASKSVQSVQVAVREAKPTRKGRRRRMSAEGRKKIADAAKRRWAKWRAENKKS